jgi:hypothetical protein
VERTSVLKALMQWFRNRRRIPEAVCAALEAEGIILIAEDLRGSITFRNYRAPGRYSSWRRQALGGAIALSQRRVVAYSGTTRLLDLPYDQPTIKAIDVQLEKPNRLLIVFEASAFHADRSGTIELRFGTPQAAQIVELLQRRTGE